MALQMAYTDPFGCEHPEAYWRLDYVAFDRNSRTGRIEFSIFHNAAARQANKMPIPSGGASRLGVPISAEAKGQAPSFADAVAAMENKGPIRAGYLLAKQLSDFIGAVDVLEAGQES